MTDLHPDKPEPCPLCGEVEVLANCSTECPERIAAMTLVERLRDFGNDLDDQDRADAAVAIEALQAERGEYRAERDALLQKPIDLAKMDSIDEDATDRMIAYYWHQQAQDARARLERVRLLGKKADDAIQEIAGCRIHSKSRQESINAIQDLIDEVLNGERM